jgi:hypothetical protein
MHAGRRVSDGFDIAELLQGRDHARRNRSADTFMPGKIAQTDRWNPSIVARAQSGDGVIPAAPCWRTVRASRATTNRSRAALRVGVCPEDGASGHLRSSSSAISPGTAPAASAASPMCLCSGCACCTSSSCTNRGPRSDEKTAATSDMAIAIAKTMTRP